MWWKDEFIAKRKGNEQRKRRESEMKRTVRLT
jgi:hypothetical protein